MLMLWLATGSFVAAHGGSARLLIDPLRVNPGGTVVVEGDDLSADDQITLVLAGPDRIDVGTFLSDGQGHLVQAFVVPVDLATGGYELQAVGSAGDTISSAIVVSGDPVEPDDGGQGGQGGQDGGLQVPLPSNWQSSLSSPAAGVVPPSREAPSSELPIAVTAVVIVGLMVIAAGVLGLLSRRRRSS